MEKGLLLLYVSPLLTGALIGLLLALYIAHSRPAPGARALVALLFGAALWSTGYAQEILSPGLESKLFWAKFQYFGIATVPLAWFVFANRYMGSLGWARHLVKYLALLGIVPGLTLFLVWTNDAHGLIWRQAQIPAADPIQALQIEHGPWFWVYLFYCYALLLAGTFQQVVGLLGAIRPHRSQIILTIIAVIIPWISNLVYIADLSPVRYLDWTPFSFTVAGLIFAYSLFRFQLVSILPIAQQAVFAGLSDCLLVLDLKNRIVDLNPCAQKMIAPVCESAYGKPVAQVLPELAGWVERAGADEDFQAEFTYGEGPDRRVYELHITPLIGPYPRPIGRLVFLYEITQLKKEQARLEQAVSERTKELMQAIALLRHELAQRTLAEKRFEDVVQSAPDAMFLLDRSSSIMLANAQAERLFGYTREELVGQSFECLVAVSQRARGCSYIEEFIANPSLQQAGLGPQLPALRKDGRVFPVEISLSLLNTADGDWVACSVRDITDRMKAEHAQRKLLEELKKSHEQLHALTFHLHNVQEIERRQIASELHDGVGQNLTGLSLNLQIIENRLSANTSQAVIRKLQDAQTLVEETTRQVRNVMANLHPPVLDEFGLVRAVNWYCATFTQRTGIAAQVMGSEFKPRLPRDHEVVLFRIVQEALNNAAKHARATRVEVLVESLEAGACITVKDDGLGFAPQALNLPNDQPHWGLLNMEQRAASIGGRLTIDSAPDRGTRVCVVVRRRQDAD